MSNISINELSQTISELIDLDLDQQSLIESAIDRAISAKDITGGRGYRPRYHGHYPKPIINGKVAYPPLINGTIVNPNPQPEVTPLDPPILVTGVIYNPDTYNNTVAQ
jgi:hypothetical protein